jgi:hypothetical protein
VYDTEQQVRLYNPADMKELQPTILTRTNHKHEAKCLENQVTKAGGMKKKVSTEVPRAVMPCHAMPHHAFSYVTACPGLSFVSPLFALLPSPLIAGRAQ